MVAILTAMIQKLSCWIAYSFLIYGALLTVFGLLSMKLVVSTLPPAFGLMLVHFLIQRFLLQISREEIVISLITDLGLITMGMLPGAVSREQGIAASFIVLVVVGCLMLFWIQPAIVHRCAIA
ncbi:MAG: hypothetical protein ACFBSF_03395 [Leptolyngbyaceae cyanobacterium]